MFLAKYVLIVVIVDVVHSTLKMFKTNLSCLFYFKKDIMRVF